MIIAGSGRDSDFLKSTANKTSAASKITFIGHVPRQEMPNLYNKSSVVVLFSAFEPFGAVALEAGSCGRPIIATRTGGPAEIIIHGKTGILVDPKDPKELISSFNQLLQDEELIQEMGNMARSLIVKNYSWHIEASSYQKLYKNLV